MINNTEQQNNYQHVTTQDTSKADQDFETSVKKGSPSSNAIASKDHKIDPENARFPYCIVWTPLPLITWILPFIGHTGIAMSDGVIHDFAGPYTITIDDLAFGETHKYVRLDVNDSSKYDRAVEKADQIYEQMMHNLFWYISIQPNALLFSNNCHSHCARALNKLNYRGRSNYTMISVWWLTITRSRYVSWWHVIKTYIGFIIIMSIIVFIKLL